MEDNENNITTLTDKECEILQLLHTHQGASKDDLLQKIWKHKADLETSTTTTHIYRLRNKIGDHNNEIICFNNGIYRLKTLH